MRLSVRVGVRFPYPFFAVVADTPKVVFHTLALAAREGGLVAVRKVVRPLAKYLLTETASLPSLGLQRSKLAVFRSHIHPGCHSSLGKRYHPLRYRPKLCCACSFFVSP